MINAKSLALYKNRPVFVAEARDRLEIRLEDGSLLRVREKDIEPLHAGPISAIPQARQGGDFETARAMAEAGQPLSFAELADLVFGSTGPAEVLACWKEGCDGSRFKLKEASLYPLSDEEVAKEAERRTRKENEAQERAIFVEKAKRAKATKKSQESETETEKIFGADDERFWAEIEALALGKSPKSRLAGEIGFSESPEGAHAFLLRVGRWDEGVNPHPSRAGCPVFPPKKPLAPDYEAPPRIDLRGLASWAIDNAWSHDPDDAVAWDEGYIYVHVADPAAAIRPGDPADEEALGRGSTLYMPEGTAPMLPDEALDRFGLGLSESSPALSFKIRIDEGGRHRDG